MMDRIPVEAWKYGVGDVLRGLLALLPGRVSSPELDLAGVGRCLTARSGRAAMVTALQSLDLEPGARVGVSLYCCPVVFKAIRAAGFEPEFVDVGPDDYCVSERTVAAKAGKIQALIAVHMFGHVCDMPAVVRAMDGKPVIEDCAQSLGSRFGGRESGTFGTMSVFSFRLGKYLSTGEGAALYTPDDGLRRRLVELSSALQAPGAFEEMKHVVEDFLRARLGTRPLWGLLGRGIWRAYNRKTDFIDKSPLIMSRMFRADRAAACVRMELLDGMIAAQRANAAFYLENLELETGMMCREKPGSFYNRLMFPLIFRTPAERNAMTAHLEDKGIGTARPYEEAIEGCAKYYGYTGDCPSAEGLLKKTMLVPVNYLLKKKDVERIARQTNEGWHRIKKGV